MRILVWLSFMASVIVSTVHCSRLPDDEIFQFDEDGCSSQTSVPAKVWPPFVPSFNAGQAGQKLSLLVRDDRVKAHGQNGGLPPERVAELEAEIRELADGNQEVIRQIGGVRKEYSQEAGLEGIHYRVHDIFNEAGINRWIVPLAVVLEKKRARQE